LFRVDLVPIKGLWITLATRPFHHLLHRQDLLDAEFMFPAIAKIILSANTMVS
jgi:hypothetical protein